MSSFEWVPDHRKFLSPREVGRLLRVAEQRARDAASRHCKVAVRDCFLVDLALSTGLRVMEIARLKCGDVFADDHQALLLVRNGKGGKRRLVRFGRTFQRHCLEYFHWKRTGGEPTGPEDPLLRSSNTGRHMTTRALQKAFKRVAEWAGLPGRYSIHCLRHTYACELYKASGHNLRMVQKQLGHSSCKTTEVYADVMDDEVRQALDRLYADCRGGPLLRPQSQIGG